MAYKGQIATIPIGRGGLVTDLPQEDIPSRYLTRAINATLVNGYAEKDFGSRRWNSSALGTGIAGFKDFWPSELVQRVICVGKNGSVYRFTNYASSSVILPTGSAPTALNVSQYANLVPCGQEESGSDRKLFIFTGNDPVQVISGDGTTRSDIASPAADWTGTNQPFMAILHRGALFAWGNRNDPHRIYKSTEVDHGNFLTGTATSYSVYPGESQRLITAQVHRKRLYVLKYPKGLYYLDDSAADSDDWFFEKSQDTIGGSSPRCSVQVLDDFLVQNQFNSVTSVQAAFTFGDFESSDYFSINRCKNFANQEISASSFGERQAILYDSKQQAMFTFRSRTSSYNDRICVISVRDPQNPMITWNTKDQPNCLDTLRDDTGIDKPCYGANDGYLYLMDQPDRWVGTSDTTVRTGYEFQIQTAHIDFGEQDATLSEQVKNYDFFEIGFIPTGKWNVSVDIFIDGLYHRTVPIELSGRSELDQFILGENRLDDGVTWSRMGDIAGSGRRIGFRLSNSGVGQNVKIAKIRVYFSVSGQEQRK